MVIATAAALASFQSLNSQGSQYRIVIASIAQKLSPPKYKLEYLDRKKNKFGFFTSREPLLEQN